MKHAYVFPGQGSQFPGMGKEHYDNSAFAKKLFEQSNEVLGFRISDIMFGGTEEDLKQTNVTQPAVFLHSIIAFRSIDGARPEMVAGHSLGEFSALVANGTLSFDSALQLVAIRAKAMQQACEANPSTMAAVLALADEKVEAICKEVQDETGEIVVPANYNCPGQLVISGTIKGVEIACERMKAAGAKRALVLPVGGAFHSPLMEPAKKELKAAIESTNFHTPTCAVYQNVVAKAVFDKEEIKQNLIDQLTGPVRWTQSVQAMIADGASIFTEAGPGKVLQGLIQKINKETQVQGVS
ncbi:ACP S-malonyltransferase [Terrimonas sp. NA20]|uniref:Malonyl CoA-acyl carrier protein transacylase n=1 Tax=Terrimonas ginsenosidimutans TaxID=2908004 RepID=A0ABS9KPH7_9BACT|nr:ACP S-malonyltransferase [Terrimonas ginsenosidimutans]MBO9657362.1 ACP S-malonyltransferase [Chitinophagaceae bacterium]MCG2614175.1 ACP S-malonyltransferase [Terrimonas ginsenosidimutans]